MPGEEMMAMEVMEVSPERLMDLADKADEAEATLEIEIRGDFSLNRINKLVDSLNRVNKIFKAPMYPKFEKAPEVFPPEFVKNIEMVQAAVMSSGLDEYDFSLGDIKDDESLKMLAGKFDAMASDKSFRAFLNKPLGMGEFQADADVPSVKTMATQDAIQSTPKAEGGDAELDLFMSRMA